MLLLLLLLLLLLNVVVVVVVMWHRRARTRSAREQRVRQARAAHRQNGIAASKAR